MYQEILDALANQLAEDKINYIKNHQCHLSIFSEPYLNYMLDGKKTIES